MYDLIITEIAELHALEAGIYYEQLQKGLSDRFLFDLEEAYRKIADHPEYYSFIGFQEIYRDIALNRFPYVIIYQIHNNDVVVVDVFNTHRQPTF